MCFSTPSLPRSLEDLLEKQWMQTSNFLMQQAQHFDIASLLSCLHELRSENSRLDKEVTELVSRRDSLLAINARLKVLPATGNSLGANATSYSALSMLSSGKGVSSSDGRLPAYTGYVSYDNSAVHSTQDFHCHKSPVGSSTLTPSPIPKPEVFPHILSQLQAQLSAFTHDASPHHHHHLLPMSSSSSQQPTSLFGTTLTTNPMLMTEANSFSSLSCQNGTTNEMQESNPESSGAVYQAISPPISSAEGCSMSNTGSLHCNNIVFHPNFDGALQQNGNINMEEDR